MTDRIDLDELDVSTDDDPERNRGDWFWQGEGSPEDEPAGPDDPDDSDDLVDTDGITETDDANTEMDSEGGREAARAVHETTETGAERATGGDTGDEGSSGHTAIPRVPRSDDDRPVGIPMDAGGGGGTAAQDRDDDPGEAPYGDPYGGTTAEMTLAFTYQAVKRLDLLHAALADTETWTDYVGLVGEVPAHVLSKFQRDQRLDLDFFNGGGMGPAERLAEVDPHSIFYADRMVVVGVDGEQWIAEEADWEFVDVVDAAAKAGWELTDEEPTNEEPTNEELADDVESRR